MVLEWAKMLMSYKFALDEMSTKLTILNEELQFVQHYNPIEHVKTRIKSPESIVEKLQRKVLKYPRRTRLPTFATLPAYGSFARSPPTYTVCTK